MADSPLLSNLLSPPILFFLLGLLAVLIRSDLEIPAPVSRFLSLYLLMAIGFKGGAELGHSSGGGEVLVSLSLAIAAALVVPFYTFFLLRGRVGVANAGAIAATYGSVSAVTFVTAAAFLRQAGVPYGGHMVAAMALMESPAIIVGVALVRAFGPQQEGDHSAGSVLREAFTNGSVVMILGSLVVGLLVGEQGVADLEPFTDKLFKGMLTLFLLDMGLLAGRRLRSLRQAGWSLIAFGVGAPLVHAAVMIPLGVGLDLEAGNVLLLTVLAASASYIAVPAAMRLAVPEANPGLYVPMSLAVTFPFNIVVGIPLYYYLIQLLLA